MKITWYGHSCFMIESDSGSVVLDPYADGSVPGLKLSPLTADFVICSHGHRDHCAEDLVRLTDREPEFQTEQLACWHDDVQGAKRGPNTITVVVADGFRAAHLGDLGHMLSKDQIRAIGRLDALMIPVGGYFTIDPETARQVADAIGATVTIPMHYRGDGFGYDVTGTVDDFAKLCDNVEYANGNSLELTKGGPRKTMILRLVK